LLGIISKSSFEASSNLDRCVISSISIPFPPWACGDR
jgi:hypothetical protein